MYHCKQCNVYICVHCFQMVAPVVDEYSQLQHDNIPPSRHDIQVR